MGCETKITKNIVSTCETQTIGGIESTVYLINRNEADITYDITNKSLITDISMATGTVAFTLNGIKKALNCSSERVVADDAADRFTHKIMFKGYEFDSESVENIDHIGDVIAIVERKDKQTEDGTFVVYGATSGLYITSDVTSANDANGARVIEMASLEGQSEKYSQNNLLDTDYATTKALLEGLLVTE